MNWQTTPLTLALLTLLLATCPAQEDGTKDIFGQREHKPNTSGKDISPDADSPFNNIKARNNRPQGVSFLPETHKKTAQEQQMHGLNRGVLANPQGAGHAKIFATLDRNVDIYFSEGHLIDLADAIRTAGGINVKLDAIPLDGVGIGEDTTFNAELKNLPLRFAMEAILGEMELDYTMRHGILYITTPEEAEETREVRVYRVEELIRPAEHPLIRRTSSSRSTVDLAAVIKATIDPESWNDLGGAGLITSLQVGDRSLLSISQSIRNHYRIAEFLAALRTASKEANPPSIRHEKTPANKSRTDDDDAKSTYIYPLRSSFYANRPAIDAEGLQLIRVVDMAIEGDGKAEYAAGCIAVRGPRSVQARVAGLLSAYNKMVDDEVTLESLDSSASRCFPHLPLLPLGDHSLPAEPSDK